MTPTMFVEPEEQLISHAFRAQPSMVIALLDLLAGETRMPDGISASIQSDPALALWLLATAAHRLDGRPLPPLAEALGHVQLANLKAHVAGEALHLLADHQDPRSTLWHWRQALYCAHLCRAVAVMSGHPRAEEAFVAGLLHNLTDAYPNHAASLQDQPRDADELADTVEAWRYNSFLADALRYQRHPMEALGDAANLVKFLGAARALVVGSDMAAQAKIERLLGLKPDTLHSLCIQAWSASEQAYRQAWPAGEEAPPSTPGAIDSALFPRDLLARLRDSLSHFICLEQFEAARGDMLGDPPGVAAAARQLSELHGLIHPMYFQHDPETGQLVCLSMAESAPQGLSINIESSNSAAAMALLWHRPVIVLVDAHDEDCSLLDLQLARLARRDGVLAIPIGDAPCQGVLVACGERRQLCALDDDKAYLAKLSALAARSRHRASCVAGGTQVVNGRQQTWQMHGRRLAHEINNPLGIIKNYLALLRMKLQDSGSVADELRIVHEELDRIARIVRTLGDEQGDPEQHRSEVDVNALLVDLVKVATPGQLQHKRVAVDSQLEPGLPPLFCDRDKLKQLLLNLLLNAIEASPEQEQVRLETHRVINHRQERQVEIVFSNRGAAIDADMLCRLFEPIPSTKGEEHSGLGLSIVKSLAEDLQAIVACRSHGGITTFQIVMPAAPAAPASAPPLQAHPTEPR